MSLKIGTGTTRAQGGFLVLAHCPCIPAPALLAAAAAVIMSSGALMARARAVAAWERRPYPAGSGIGQHGTGWMPGSRRVIHVHFPFDVHVGPTHVPPRISRRAGLMKAVAAATTGDDADAVDAKKAAAHQGSSANKSRGGSSSRGADGVSRRGAEQQQLGMPLSACLSLAGGRLL